MCSSARVISGGPPEHALLRYRQHGRGLVARAEASFSTARLDTGIETPSTVSRAAGRTAALQHVSGLRSQRCRETVARDVTPSGSTSADYSTSASQRLARALRHVVEERLDHRGRRRPGIIRSPRHLRDGPTSTSLAQVGRQHRRLRRQRPLHAGRPLPGPRQAGSAARGQLRHRGEGVLAGVDYLATKSFKVSLAGTTGGIGNGVQAGARLAHRPNNTLYGTYTLSSDRTAAERCRASSSAAGSATSF